MNLKPCTKFANNSPTKQLMHVLQEVGEVASAFVAWKWARWRGKDGYKELQHLALEAVDLQTACETFLLCTGFGSEARSHLRIKTVLKNANRGYYQAVNK